MRLIIAGGRDWKPTDDDITEALVLFDIRPIEIVTGGAKGVDTAAFDWAWRHNIPVRVFSADWKKHGRAAGPIRNRAMAEYGEALMAFRGGRGTADMIRAAQERGLPVFDMDVQRLAEKMR